MGTIADRIKEARDARNMTQADVAREVKKRYPKARFTQQNLAALEKIKSNATAYVVELSDVLGVNPDWLALGRGPRDRGKGLVVSDQKLITAVGIMEPMADYQKDQAIKILDAIAQPGEDQPRDKKTDNG